MGKIVLFAYLRFIAFARMSLCRLVALIPQPQKSTKHLQVNKN